MFVHGLKMRGLSGADVDVLVRTTEVAAIEVYADSRVPPQFQDALSGCGSIVLWTKEPLQVVSRGHNQL